MTLRVLAACCASILLTAPMAFGAGINLNWNDCVMAGLQTNRSFACNSNSGSNVMVASFEPPSGITKLVGSSAVIDVEFAAPLLPSWWQLSSGGCRAGALSLDLSPPASQACIDYWSGAAMGSFAYQAGYGGPNVARITVSFGIPEALAGPVEPGNEYYAFRLIMDNSKTIGTGACAGCLVPACIIMTALWLYQPPGLGDYLLCVPAWANHLAWQGGNIDPPGCPPVHFPPGDCASTPAVRRSWGLVKGLYR